MLGVLIQDPQPLRLADVGAHPRVVRIPARRIRRCTRFLGVPIVVRGEVWGNLYLTEKAAGEFTEEDEDAAVVLADWAAIAIDNARLYRDVRQRRDELAAREPRARDDDGDQRARSAASRTSIGCSSSSRSARAR